MKNPEMYVPKLGELFGNEDKIYECRAVQGGRIAAMIVWPAGMGSSGVPVLLVIKDCQLYPADKLYKAMKAIGAP